MEFQLGLSEFAPESTLLGRAQRWALDAAVNAALIEVLETEIGPLLEEYVDSGCERRD